MQDLLSRISEGFAGLVVDDAKRQAALRNLATWLQSPELAVYRAAIEGLVARGDWDLLLYNFFRTMPFGTGGRRGPVGVGPNCFNEFTLATSVEGHVRYLRQRFGAETALKVVIAFDVRVFRDMKGRYRGLETPLMGVRSRDFARIAAEVYARNGVQVFLPDPEGAWVISTPELSFAIRHLGAHGGLNVSASHNHPDDSGGKFYESRGGQEVPPYDEEFSTLVESVERAERMPWDEARAAGLVQLMDREVHDAYVASNLSLSAQPESRSARVVFTNLHGAGDTNVGEVLERAGFEVHYVPSQRPHDGQFPAVPFRIANPEVPESMNLAAALAQEVGADLVLSTDPDADRIGLMVPSRDNGVIFVNGNEIGALVTEQRFSTLKAAGALPERPLFVTTEVTSRLPVAVAQSYGADVVSDLLVGCKYIADVIAQLEEQGEVRGRPGTLGDYVIGLEESHGVMVSPAVRDKDAAGAALLLAEMASTEKARGGNLLSALRRLWKRVGVHATSQVSIVIEGAVGMEAIAKIQEGFRALPLGASLGGSSLSAIDDFWDESAHGPFLSQTDRTARNFLSLRLASGARLLCRPSGTEPKLKIYTEAIRPPLGEGATDDAVLSEQRALVDELGAVTDLVAQQAYRFLGLEMPLFGLRLSPLLPLQHRRDFVQSAVVELAERAAAGGDEPLEAWVRRRLAAYGADPLALVKNAVAAWLPGAALPAQAEADVRFAFGF